VFLQEGHVSGEKKKSESQVFESMGKRAGPKLIGWRHYQGSGMQTGVAPFIKWWWHLDKHSLFG